MLCASEERGAHPAAIATSLTRGADGAHVLRGKKKWTTFGPAADELLVVATTGADEVGRNRLKLVRIDARRAGVVVREMPPTPFAPELPHAQVEFVDVRVAEDEVLEGDGYARYLKPFRTVEDAHVLGAFVGHVAGLARVNAWPPDALEEALGVVALSARSPRGIRTTPRRTECSAEPSGSWKRSPHTPTGGGRTTRANRARGGYETGRCSAWRQSRGPSGSRSRA